jgi:hypothetical protein
MERRVSVSFARVDVIAWNDIRKAQISVTSESAVTYGVHPPSFSLERLGLSLLKHLATRFRDAIDANYVVLHVL